MSLDVSLKHTEYMFRHEILKVIIIEVPPFLAHLSQCVRCIINSYSKLLDGIGVYQTWQKWSLYGPFYFFFQIVSVHCISTRVIFYVRREVDLMKTANVNAYIMHIFGKIELLSIHAT